MQKKRQLTNKEGRPAKSAHPGSRVKKNLIELNKPALVDLTKDQLGYGIRPSTAIQLQQIQKINEFNKSLPPKKRVASSLPMIQANNIATKSIIRKDHKKGKIEEIVKYNPVGFIDDNLDPNDDNGSKFSMLGKVRNIGI